MLVLTDKKLNIDILKKRDIKVVVVKKQRELLDFNKNKDVVAICGSRGMAKIVNDMEFPNLKLFQLTSAGFDGVPIESYASKNIAVANAGDVYSIPIAETVVFGMLQFAKRLRSNPNNRHFKPLRKYNLISELAQKKVLILGAGNIGTAVADRLLGFEVKVDGFDPFCLPKQQYGEIIRNRKTLLEKVGDYEYIISTLPANNYTTGFIDAELLGKMKREAVIINVGRKSVFNESDFYEALKYKKISGAVLDIFEKIPNPITNRFRRLSNVVVLPGVAAISKELDIRLRDVMTNNVVSVIKGTEIDNVINGVL